MITVFENARVFDGWSEEIIEGARVVVEGDRIKDVAAGPWTGPADRRVDCAGRFLMPGLIDAHFHAYTPSFDIIGNDHLPPAFMASHAVRLLEGCLERGFTTVRDAAGGDIGLWMAIEKGLIRGPRFFFAGKALSQTGGHGDPRPGAHFEPCGCHGYSGSLSIVADGADGVRKATREELRKGAHQIKIFVSGGGISPTDPMWMPQFTEDEIRAAVHEASTRNTYVMAHSHTDDSSRRCAEYGVRTIEHGTLIHREDTARLLAEKGVFVVPTFSVVDVLVSHCETLRIPADKVELIKHIWDDMLRSAELLRRSGVKLGLGADLLGTEFHGLQGGELALRGLIDTPLEVLRSATSVNAEILRMSGQLGCVAPGAFADLLVLEGDPFKDLGLFRDLANLPVVMKAGDFVRCGLG